MARKITLRGLLFASVCAAVFAAAQPAFAEDSGEERVVPINKWKCAGCGWTAFTFDPDDIGLKAKSDNKVPSYQQSNWVMFYDSSRPVPKCQKSRNGAHLFDKSGSAMESPATIRKTYKDFIVLKSGSAMKVKIAQIICAICRKNDFYFFHGDDGDMYGRIPLGEANQVFNMQNGSQVGACKSWKVGGMQSSRHMFHTQKTTEMKSIDLAKMIAKLWYSN